MKISVIGCGWLGLPLSSLLHEEGHLVRGSTTSKQKLQLIESKGIIPHLINLTPELTGEIKGFFDVDLIIINIPPRNLGDDNSYHHRQIKSLKKQIVSHQIPKLLFVSSTGVYPNVNGVVVEEDASDETRSRGGVPLLEIEHLIKNIPNTECTVLRFGGLYGPQRDPANFFKGRTEIPGKNNPVNMIHLVDAIGIINTIISGNHWNKIYNAASPDERSRAAFYREAARASGLTPPTFSDAPLDFKKVSTDKLIKETGYQFKY